MPLKESFSLTFCWNNLPKLVHSGWIFRFVQSLRSKYPDQESISFLKTNLPLPYWLRTNGAILFTSGGIKYEQCFMYNKFDNIVDNMSLYNLKNSIFFQSILFYHTYHCQQCYRKSLSHLWNPRSLPFGWALGKSSC